MGIKQGSLLSLLQRAALSPVVVVRAQLRTEEPPKHMKGVGYLLCLIEERRS